MTKKITGKHKKTGPKGPSKMIEDTIKKLEDGFKSDFTDQEACAYAGITPSLYYLYCQTDKKFLERMTSAKEYCFIMAKNNVRKGLNEGDKEYSLKRLSKRQNTRYTEKVDNNTNISGELNTKIVYLPEKPCKKKE